MSQFTQQGQHVEELAKLTREEVEEALRLARLGLHRYRTDQSDLAMRLAACEARIEEQERLKLQWQDLAEQAPERITRVLERIEGLEKELAREERKPRAAQKSTAKVLKEAKIALLMARIKNGDMKALEELRGML